MSKMKPRWEYGIFIGIRQRSGEVWVASEDKISTARSVRRIPVEERWSEDSVGWVKVVPCNRYRGDAEADGEVPEVARSYKTEGIGTIVVGDENYGEGSSREHAAMEPRFRGCKVVIVKSFARIHEANLKKQGILALTFDNKDDYELIDQDDKLTIQDPSNIEPDKQVVVNVEKSDGKILSIFTNHSLSDEQITWFKAGSALNYIKSS